MAITYLYIGQSQLYHAALRGMDKKRNCAIFPTAGDSITRIVSITQTYAPWMNYILVIDWPLPGEEYVKIQCRGHEAEFLGPGPRSCLAYSLGIRIIEILGSNLIVSAGTLTPSAALCRYPHHPSLAKPVRWEASARIPENGVNHE